MRAQLLSGASLQRLVRLRWFGGVQRFWLRIGGIPLTVALGTGFGCSLEDNSRAGSEQGGQVAQGGQGAEGGTAGAAGNGGAGDECVAPMRQSGCFGTPICPSFWCPEARHLRLERLPEAECVFVITDAGLPEVVAYDDYQVALVLPSADGSADAEELLTSLGGDISACAARLSEDDEAWLLDISGDQLSFTVCPCVCDRMGQEGWLDVVYGCGGGPLWMG